MDLMTSIRPSNLIWLRMFADMSAGIRSGSAITANNVGKTIANFWFILAVMAHTYWENEGFGFPIPLQTAVPSLSRRFETF